MHLVDVLPPTDAPITVRILSRYNPQQKFSLV
jgi:hypothetical protein